MKFRKIKQFIGGYTATQLFIGITINFGKVGKFESYSPIISKISIHFPKQI